MTITIRNDREEMVGFIKVEDGHVVEDELKGLFYVDIDINNDGSAHYTLEIPANKEVVENLSNETILRELSSRLCQ